MKKNTIPASELQQRLIQALRDYKDFRKAPDGLITTVLNGLAFTKKHLVAAVTSIFAEAYYNCAKDSKITQSEEVQLDRLKVLLNLSDEQTVSIRYKVGLAIYKKKFREAISDGDLSEDGYLQLQSVKDYFGLRKKDVDSSVSQQALAFYSFALSDALKDGVLDDAEMARLTILVRQLGLNSKQLRTISIPNKKEILSTALGAIKARGEITDGDYDHIRSLADFLNATEDLLKPCLMDLDLYARIFEIRSGRLPEIPPSKLILDQGEKLHYLVPATYEVTKGGKIQRQSGTLYIGSRKVRFVGLRRSYEIRYVNFLQVDLSLQKNPKLSVSVARGVGNGAYRMRNVRDIGEVVELHEAIRFLIRKAKGLEVQRGVGSRYIPADVRSEVWYRDGGKCVICGATEYLEFDHNIPLSKGGATSVENLQILCRKCNSEKSDSI